MPLDRKSFRYRFEKAYGRGWALPEPINKTQENIKNEILMSYRKREVAKQDHYKDVMTKKPLNIDVAWSKADLTVANGTVIVDGTSFGDVKLTRRRGTPLLTFIGPEHLKEFPVILSSTATLLGKPWSLPATRLSKFTTLSYVPGMEWGRDEHTITIIQLKVPSHITDIIFDVFGIESEHIINSWYSMSSKEQTESRKLWTQQWAIRHAESKDPEEPVEESKDPEEPVEEPLENSIEKFKLTETEPEIQEKYTTKYLTVNEAIGSALGFMITEWEGSGTFRKGVLRSPYSWVRKIVLKVKSDGSGQIRVFGYSNQEFSATIISAYFMNILVFRPKMFAAFRGHYTNVNYREVHFLLKE